MKIFRCIVAVGLWVGLLASANADQRYQAVSIGSGADFGTEKALILDTVAGHMWIWTESPATEDEPGGRYIIYQGLLVPGNEIGDVVLKQEWPQPILAPPNGTK
ncbi:MAG: hypothetical protein EXR86_10525 [Gammaproteobacteria bacterium]|nr:hypothetical protein [Gammaproteobacteria bacterium]